MGALDRLKAYSKLSPADEGAISPFSEISGKSDRAAIIVSASRIDDTLEFAISCLMRPLGPSLDVEIFRNRGPLAGFSDRILIADALGLLTEIERNSLNTIRAVRNECAHCRNALSLDMDVLRNAVIRAFIGYVSDTREMLTLAPAYIQALFIDHCFNLEESIIDRAKLIALASRPSRPLHDTPLPLATLRDRHARRIQEHSTPPQASQE